MAAGRAGRIVATSTIKKRVGPVLKEHWVTQTAKYAGFGDTKYYLPTSDEIRQLLRDREIPEPQGEIFDCEDFAFVCKAHVSEFVRQTGAFPASICLGIAWGRFDWVSGGAVDHACNWGLDDLGHFFWYEPQDDRYFSASHGVRHRLRLLLV